MLLDGNHSRGGWGHRRRPRHPGGRRRAEAHLARRDPGAATGAAALRYPRAGRRAGWPSHTRSSRRDTRRRRRHGEIDPHHPSQLRPGRRPRRSCRPRLPGRAARPGPRDQGGPRAPPVGRSRLRRRARGQRPHPRGRGDQRRRRDQVAGRGPDRPLRRGQPGQARGRHRRGRAADPGGRRRRARPVPEPGRLQHLPAGREGADALRHHGGGGGQHHRARVRVHVPRPAERPRDDREEPRPPGRAGAHVGRLREDAGDDARGRPVRDDGRRPRRALRQDRRDGARPPGALQPADGGRHHRGDQDQGREGRRGDRDRLLRGRAADRPDGHRGAPRDQGRHGDLERRVLQPEVPRRPAGALRPDPRRQLLAQSAERARQAGDGGLPEALQLADVVSLRPGVQRDDGPPRRARAEREPGPGEAPRGAGEDEPRRPHPAPGADPVRQDRRERQRQSALLQNQGGKTVVVGPAAFAEAKAVFPVPRWAR